jgi:hypothetical protein
MIEFFWTTEKVRLIVHDIVTGEFEPFDLHKLGMAKKIDRLLLERYPETHKKLCQLYGDTEAYAFVRVNRFLKCNFSVHDNRPDIDDDWNFEFELVPCPLRGECKDGICTPILSNDISNREIEVIRLHVEGYTQAEIGDRLFISEHTVHNHINNIYRKLGFTGRSNPDKLLINYAYKNLL